MEIEISEIVDGKMDGKYVWICDYRSSGGDKPLRHVRPQRVLIRSNDEINDRVYYSCSHFATLNKKGEPLKKIIKPFDNTGYRSFTGTPVCVYDNEKECVDQYTEFDKWMNPIIERSYTFNDIVNAGLCIVEADGNLLNEKMLIEKLKL